METKLWVYNTKITIKPTDPIQSTRRLTSFCCANGIRNALMKSQGGWYWLHMDGKLELMNRCLGNITFEELFNKAKTNSTMSTGNTTRIVDRCIQELFTNKITYVYEGRNEKNPDELTLACMQVFTRRMQSEHPDVRYKWENVNECGFNSYKVVLE
jgi:hypothetical protein